MKFYFLALLALCTFGCTDNQANNRENQMKNFGYKGNPDLWSSFLDCWQMETLSKLEEKDDLSELEIEILSRGSQNFSGAIIQEIEKKENQLGITLPESYRHFLMASNGWIQPNLDDYDGEFLAIEDVSLFSERFPDFYSIIIQTNNSPVVRQSIYMENYSSNQDPAFFDDDHIRGSIVISSDLGPATYLINTNLSTPENELEVWHYASSHPGAFRFVSFAHLMQSTYLRTTEKYNYYGPAPIEKIKGTCAEILGFPKIE